jgi:hypothetical protein
VVEYGDYTCTVENGTAILEGSASSTGPTYLGVYDPGSGILEWDGVCYRPVETK